MNYAVCNFGGLSIHVSNVQSQKYLNCVYYSVKFVGLFVVLLAGVTVAWELWNMIGDLEITLVCTVNDLLARTA